MLDQINEMFGYLVDFLAPILFLEIKGFPLIVLVLLFGSLTFTLYFRFININTKEVYDDFKSEEDIFKLINHSYILPKDRIPQNVKFGE